MSNGSVASENGRMIVVASGKGGVGKTWFSISLAQALARKGRRVLLADADLGLANIDVQLGIQPERDLSAVLSGKMTPAEAATRIPDAGFDVLPGRSGSGALASLSPTALDAFLAHHPADLIDGVGVIAPVGEHHLRRRPILGHQRLVALHVIGLAAGQDDGHRQAQAVGPQVDLGREATSRAAKTSTLRV